jgi:glycosyltransferase involved in cell wall biosynthesis
VLLPQVDKYIGEIEILIFFNNFEYSLGYLRQCLLDEARGEYISHIDDDDMIPDDYCDTIYPLLDGVDYIGFMVDFYDKGKKMKPVYHSLRYSEWTEDGDGYYRGVTHLNPVRTELARKSNYPSEFNTGEDAAWARGMKDICKTEHYIDRPMYYYWHNAYDSVAYAITNSANRVGFNPDITHPHDTPIQPKFKSKNVRLHFSSTKENP